jgi:hypothetical protein
MRRFLSASLGFILLILPGCQSGKPAELPSLTIEKVRIGLPAGPDSTRSRTGVWCPVYVTLKAGKTDVAPDTLRLVVKANDADETPFRYTLPVPALKPEEERMLVTYTRPGTATGDLDVLVTTKDGRVVQAMRRIQRNVARDVLEPKEPLLVSVGSRALRPDPAAQDDQPEEEIKQKNLAYLDSVAQMPDQWFGYEAADVVVLSTRDERFVNALTEEKNETRREALMEWVRRGGRLVLSVGKNNATIVGGDGPDTLLKKMPVIGCQFGPDAVTVPVMSGLAAWAHVSNPNQAPLRSLDIAEVQIQPDRGVTVIKHENVQDGKKLVSHPALLQGSLGLGRVILLPFDVEANPFAAWPGRKEFWEQLQKELKVRADAPKPIDPNLPGAVTQPPELLNEIQRNLESFQEVPTVSFGWVSLFMLFYIALVGPLDYFVLKKFFKRLEMTWVTFPATVILVSATAYFTAYWLKGDDVHIKKLDVVDIDLRDNTAVGTTWFSLFSPRIQNFTVGVEPVSAIDNPAFRPWVAPAGNDDRPIRSWNVKPATPNRPVHRTTLAVLAAPDQSRRAGSATLYPEPYDCTEGATGLEKVPIPVWATRSFTATWTARLAGEPPIQAALKYPRPGAAGDPPPLGDLTNNLPVALEGVGLIYREHWYNLGTLEPGETRAVGELFSGGPKAPRLDWFKDNVLRPEQPQPVQRDLRRRRPAPENAFDPNDLERTVSVKPPHVLMKQALFYSESEQRSWLNSGLRSFDQSWRLARPNAEQNRDEVILVARAGPLRGNAEELTKKGVAPTALWLDRLPGTLSERPKLEAFLTQETYVRVYIPVARSQ